MTSNRSCMQDSPPSRPSTSVTKLSFLSNYRSPARFLEDVILPSWPMREVERFQGVQQRRAYIDNHLRPPISDCLCVAFRRVRRCIWRLTLNKKLPTRNNNFNSIGRNSELGINLRNKLGLFRAQTLSSLSLFFLFLFLSLLCILFQTFTCAACRKLLLVASEQVLREVD